MTTEILASGTYAAKNTKTVTVWPAPDKDGDGPELFHNNYAESGEFLGRDLVRDNQGYAVHEYLPPEGFMEMRTSDPGADGATATYIRTDPRGRPLRNHLGQAIGIVPGSALVEYPDGTFELLRDDYSKMRFARAHDVINSDGSVTVSEHPVSPSASNYKADPPAGRQSELQQVLGAIEGLASGIGNLVSQLGHRSTAPESPSPDSGEETKAPPSEGWKV